MLHMEQLQSAVSSVAGASTSNRTRPQWQPPACVTITAVRARSLRRPLLMLVLLSRQIVNQGHQALRAPGCAHIGYEFAVDRKGRNAVDAVALHQLIGSLQGGLYGKRVVCLLEVLFGNAEFLDVRGLQSLRCRHVVRVAGYQGIPIDMDLLEYLAVQLVELAEALQRVIHTCQRTVTLAPGHGYPREADVRRLALLPRFDRGVDRVAMRARVPEEFQHLDLTRGDRRRLRRHEPRVVDALLPQRRRGQAGRRRRRCGWRPPPGNRGQNRIAGAAVAGRILDGRGSVFIRSGKVSGLRRLLSARWLLRLRRWTPARRRRRLLCARG